MKYLSKYLKYAGLAAVLSGFSFGIAQAAAPTPIPPPLPSQPGALANSAMAVAGLQNQSGGTKSTTNGGLTNAAFSIGWNFRVCKASQWYSPDNINFYVYAYNTDGSNFWYKTGVTLASAQNQLVAACQHGTAGYWIYITNTVSLTYSSVWVYYP